MVDKQTEMDFQMKLDDSFNLVNSFFLTGTINEEQFDFLTYALVNLRSAFEESKEMILQEYFRAYF